jgi:hypothetical protein
MDVTSQDSSTFGLNILLSILLSNTGVYVHPLKYETSVSPVYYVVVFTCTDVTTPKSHKNIVGVVPKQNYLKL